ncbi:hypothetical protein MMC25_005380 [Agyrium rufum]|nr:hypothetical protein [Agyrium rufum]
MSRSPKHTPSSSVEDLEMSPTRPIPTSSSEFTVHTAVLYDPGTKSFRMNTSLRISAETGLITSISTRSTSSAPSPLSSKDIDLTHLPVILPGLVDAHTHIFLHPYSEASSTIQMRDESPTERTIRAVNHVRRALLAGYTTYRDLGTEGTYYGNADVDVRNAINRGLIPGPRLYVATMPLATTGGYVLHGGENPGTKMPTISDAADGVAGVTAAVRRRIAAGADVIKVYSDYRRRPMRYPPPLNPASKDREGGDLEFPPPPTWDISDKKRGDRGGIRNPNSCMWTPEEFKAVVQEAERAQIAVAAHCGTNDAIVEACRAGVTTIEHGYAVDGRAIEWMKRANVVYVPTLAVFSLYLTGKNLDEVLSATKKAFDAGIPLACGGDTGTFPHGDNVLELEMMLKAGIPLEEVLWSATEGGWWACGGKQYGEVIGRRFGSLEVGCVADFVGLGGDVRKDVGALRNVNFVMKDGKIWKKGGNPVGTM